MAVGDPPIGSGLLDETLVEIGPGDNQEPEPGQCAVTDCARFVLGPCRGFSAPQGIRGVYVTACVVTYA